MDLITTPMIAAQRDKRLLSGVSPRTANLDLIAIRAVFKKCVEDGLIVRNPMDKLTKLKQGESRERKFLRPAQLQSLLEEAVATDSSGRPKYRNGDLLADFLKLLAYSGAREQEALGLRWSDVDFIRKQLTIGADGDTKNSKIRRVDFSGSLEAHLRDMANRRDPESVFLFPALSVAIVMRLPGPYEKRCGLCAPPLVSTSSCLTFHRMNENCRVALGSDSMTCVITSPRFA